MLLGKSIIIPRGGRHDARTVSDGVRLWATVVCTYCRLRFARPRRSDYRIPRRIQPDRDRDASPLRLVPDADIWISRMVGGPDRGRDTLFCADSHCGAGRSVAASAGVVL